MIVNFTNSVAWRIILLVLLIVAITAGCASVDGHGKPAAVREFSSGYLSPEELPNSSTLLPPPPATGSAAFALDIEISQRSFILRDTPRWTLAIADANLEFPYTAGTFSCALNAPITEKDTPYLYMLLRRTLTDLGVSTSAAKKKYERPRPFVLNKEPFCTPDDKSFLEKDGSYPSGHTAIGWGWALILSEISPAQTNAILARGLAFGESRNVCNVHWHSDVIQGRLIAAGTVARLHANSAFLSDLEAAKAELAYVRSKGLKPMRDCNAEAAALSLQPSLAQ
jgi:acid phosphatase (class A)